jgi:hypothetical protein
LTPTQNVEHLETMATAEKSTTDRRRVGPYSRKLQRGAIGDCVDGRSAEGRFIRDLERQLVDHVGGSPSVTQRLLIERIIKIKLQLDGLDDKLTSGDWTAHDQRTYGALLNAQRLCLRELGLGPAPRLMLNRAGHGSQMGAQSAEDKSLSPAEAYRLMIAGGDPNL